MPKELRGVPFPKQGVSVVVAAARGHVRVRRPGDSRFVPLDAAGRVPVGSVLDARHGRVQLVSAVGSGVQSGVFWGTRFRATQSRRGGGMTTLTLRGPELRRCGRTTAKLAFASKKKRRRVRSLWARDRHGRFRTHGHDSVATARGTAWFTRETCAGTRTRVTRGAVSVRDLRRHRTVLVKAGHSYLARRHAR
jgi:ferric-dicitrate binding protein FerR (iron transport regulator)